MGSIINYGEGKNNGHPLLLIHGQGGDWKVYLDSFLKLSKKYHIYAIDCYGHGKSSHNPENYNIVDNGDDIIWFIENVIKRETIISGHSSGGLLAIYVASKNNPLVSGVMLEDPPIFSTLKDYAPKTWAYLDSFKTINDYLTGSMDEPYDVYYLKNALWGQMFMKDIMPTIANHASRQIEKNPDKPPQFFYFPKSINQMFTYFKTYDLEYGNQFYNYTWHNDVNYEKLLVDIDIPVVYMHANEMFSEDGEILMAAATFEQAKRTCALIVDLCEFIEIESSHDIHVDNPEAFIDAIDRVYEKLKNANK